MPAFRVTGDVLIACNCDWGCPCNFNARPSRGFCQGGWIWRIDEGQADGVELAGLGAAVFAKWPGAIHEGGGRAICYVDGRADARQEAALARMMRGDFGGPWGIFIKTYDLAAPIAAPFQIDFAQYGSRAAIGDLVELELQTIKNPVSNADAHPEVVLPEGLVVKRGTLAASSVFRVKDTIGFDHSGQYAALGQFDYA